MKFRTSAAIALSALVLAGCATASPSAAPDSNENGPPDKLKVATVNVYTGAALELGIENGYFADRNLEIEIEQVPNPAALVATLEGGQADIAMVPSTVISNGLAQGIDFKIVAAADGYGPLPEGIDPEPSEDRMEETSLVATPESGIEAPKDLEGKTVAVPARKAQLEVTIADAVAQDGGDPDTIEWVPLDFQGAIAALKSERVDAAGFVMPFNRQAVEEGGVFVEGLGRNFFGEISVQQWLTSPDIAAEKEDALLRFREAIYEANAYSNENLDEALDVAADIVGLPAEDLKQDALPYWPTEHDSSHVEQVAEKMVELGYLDEVPDTSKLDWNP